MSGPFQLIQSAADANGCDYGTVVNHIKRKNLRVFKLPGRRGHFVDVNEARAVLSKRQRYGSFGEGVEVIDLSTVVADFDVVE